MTTPTLTTPPSAPSRADPANFRSRADAFLGWFSTAFSELTTMISWIVTQLSTMAGYVNASATSASNAAASEVNAALYAASASAAAGVVLWVSGTTYAAGACVYSPTNFQTYRRKSAGAGTTDPSADATNWTLLGTYVSNISIERAVRRARQSTFA